MDSVTLLARAGAAGLTVTAEGDRLVVRGPKQAAPLAEALIARKPDVMALLQQPHDPRLLTAPAETQARLLSLAELTGWPRVQHWTGVVVEGEQRWREWTPRMNQLSSSFFTGALERRRLGCPDGVGLDEWLGRDHDAEQAKESESA